MSSPSPFRLFWHRVLTWSGPLLLLFFLAHKGIEWQTERLWFEAVNYRGHFDHLMLWRLGTFVLGAGLMALWLGINAQVAWRNAARSAVPLGFFETSESPRLIPFEDKLQLDRFRRRATIIVVGLLSWLMGLAFANRYPLFLRAFYSQQTGQVDQASNFDLEFFLFQLPLWQWMSRFCMVALIAGLFLVVAIYLYEETIGFTERSPRWSGYAARHIATLWVILLLWKASDSLLGVPLSFVNSGNVPARVFDQNDIRFGWTASALLALMAPFLALLSAIAIAKKPRYQTFLIGLLWMVSTRVIPFVVPLMVGHSPKDVEWQGAISRHVSDTRTAWGLSQVKAESLQIESSAEFNLTESIELADSTSHPLPFWPALSVREAMNIRLDARNLGLEVERVDLERRNGSLFYVGVAGPRAPQAARSWRQRRLRLATGAVLQVEATRTRPDGGPLFAPEIPAPHLFGPTNVPFTTSFRRSSRSPAGGSFEPTITPADDDTWVLASAQDREVQGVPLQNFGVRLALATRFTESGFLRHAPQPKDVVLWHRSAASRCRQLAPFLNWPEAEARPLLLPQRSTSGNRAQRLVWVVPGLVWSDDYPDSATPAIPGTSPPGVNYGRQGAVGVVDALSGQISLFALTDDEPYIALYRRAFPGLFSPPTALSNEIRDQLRPSPTLLKAQSMIWSRYHEDDPTTWETGKNNWRPLLSPLDARDTTLRPLASHPTGEWTVMAFALANGQAGAPGSASPLVGILGADERSFSAQGQMRFVEWRPRRPMPLPEIAAQPTEGTLDGRVPQPPLTFVSIAPTFDGKGDARGLLVTQGVIRPRLARNTREGVEEPGVKLDAKAASVGLAAITLPERRTVPNAPQLVQQAKTLDEARTAWRDLLAARQQGNWSGVARAEKRLGQLLQRQETGGPLERAP